jgi:hypothetical protein
MTYHGRIRSTEERPFACVHELYCTSPSHVVRSCMLLDVKCCHHLLLFYSIPRRPIPMPQLSIDIAVSRHAA